MSGQDGEQLTLFPADSHASRSAPPGSAEARRMTVTSGRKCCELLKNSGPLGSLARMLLVSSVWSSPFRLLEWRAEALTDYRTRTIMRRYFHDKKICCSSHSSETLNVSDTKSSHLLFRLVPLERRTEGTELPWLPTPTVADTFTGGLKSSQQKPGSMHSVNLSNAVRMWPTPKASDAIMGMTARTSGRPLEKSTHLQAQVYVRTMLPTPIATDWKNRGCKDYRKNREFQLQTYVGGQLNPTWVEWLMGFPLGWTDLDASETP